MCLQFCECRVAFTLQTFTNGTVHCLHTAKPNTSTVIACVIIGFLVALLAATGCAVWLHRGRHLQSASYKHAGPPGDFCLKNNLGTGKKYVQTTVWLYCSRYMWTASIELLGPSCAVLLRWAPRSRLMLGMPDSSSARYKGALHHDGCRQGHRCW